MLHPRSVSLFAWVMGDLKGLFYVILGKGFMVYPCENALDRDLNLSCGNLISVLLIAALLSQLAQDFSS